ncbi:hypothetical protein JL101_036195 (plasmid) [Skermanella rosea]|uniref:hypothetical protein n=1 Tax=Skermanella rosea TaxID=1817965 RepID=UPI00193455DD|nr:hypothetical protein [Skermanella rosea]UEM08197.1 hypothetical protein JL101_036195 [Skermanella rosea]
MADIDNPPAAPTRYNRIYESLVPETGDDDLVGMIAYALYKQSKREWLVSFEREHGVRPSQSDVDAYVRSQTQYEIKRLRSQAESMLSAYAYYVVDQETPAIRESAINNHVLDEATKTLQTVKKQGRWRHQFTAGAVGAFGYTLLLIALALILKLAGVDLLSIVEKIG